MRVFIAGATGVLGRRLVRLLMEQGHQVRGLSRNDANDRVLTELGAIPGRAALEAGDALDRAVQGAEVVVHAATAIPIAEKFRPDDWRENDRIRRAGTEALVRAAVRAGARQYLQQSVVWVVGQADGTPFDESTPPRPSRLFQSALDGEEIARDIGTGAGLSVAVLRAGSFYAADAGHTRQMARLLTAHRFPLIDGGRAYWSSVHVDDVASGFAAAITAGRSGLWHVVGDEPMMLRDLLRLMIERIGAPPPRRVPGWLARLVIGGEGLRFLKMSTRTTNAALKRDLGWQPRFPTLQEGLDQVVGVWRQEGFLGLADRPVRVGG